VLELTGNAQYGRTVQLDAAAFDDYSAGSFVAGNAAMTHSICYNLPESLEIVHTWVKPKTVISTEHA
jgi:hypothetical protein